MHKRIRIKCYLKKDIERFLEQGRLHEKVIQLEKRMTELAERARLADYEVMLRNLP